MDSSHDEDERGGEEEEEEEVGEEQDALTTVEVGADADDYSPAPCAAALPACAVSSATFERLAAPRLPTEDEDERYWSDAATVRRPRPPARSPAHAAELLAGAHRPGVERGPPETLGRRERTAPSRPVRGSSAAAARRAGPGRAGSNRAALSCACLECCQPVQSGRSLGVFSVYQKRL